MRNVEEILIWQQGPFEDTHAPPTVRGLLSHDDLHGGLVLVEWAVQSLQAGVCRFYSSSAVNLSDSLLDICNALSTSNMSEQERALYKRRVQLLMDLIRLSVQFIIVASVDSGVDFPAHWSQMHSGNVQRVRTGSHFVWLAEYLALLCADSIYDEDRVRISSIFFILSRMEDIGQSMGDTLTSALCWVPSS